MPETIFESSHRIDSSLHQSPKILWHCPCELLPFWHACNFVDKRCLPNIKSYTEHIFVLKSEEEKNKLGNWCEVKCVGCWSNELHLLVELLITTRKWAESLHQSSIPNHTIPKITIFLKNEKHNHTSGLSCWFRWRESRMRVGLMKNYSCRIFRQSQEYFYIFV